MLSKKGDITAIKLIVVSVLIIIIFITLIMYFSKGFDATKDDTNKLIDTADPGDAIEDTKLLLYCGNGECEIDKEENCQNCIEDCGCDEEQCCYPDPIEFDRGCIDEAGTSIDNTKVCCNHVLEHGECCEDSNCASDEYCYNYICEANCGNHFIDVGEMCDDGNTNRHDGCSRVCTIESGWNCEGEPSHCSLGSQGQCIDLCPLRPNENSCERKSGCIYECINEQCSSWGAFQWCSCVQGFCVRALDTNCESFTLESDCQSNICDWVVR